MTAIHLSHSVWRKQNVCLLKEDESWKRGWRVHTWLNQTVCLFDLNVFNIEKTQIFNFHLLVYPRAHVSFLATPGRYDEPTVLCIYIYSTFSWVTNVNPSPRTHFTNLVCLVPFLCPLNLFYISLFFSAAETSKPLLISLCTERNKKTLTHNNDSGLNLSAG